MSIYFIYIVDLSHYQRHFMCWLFDVVGLGLGLGLVLKYLRL